ncbi:MAG TPA: hypothetical protein PK890_09130 [Terrimesophilobacter sp.]|nr:hypothetical protein [Terrimesophilobacter sp.]
MNTEFSPRRSDAIRAELIDTVEQTTKQKLTGTPRRWLTTVGVLTAGMIIGGAVSAAAFTLGGVSADTTDAPLPGQDVLTPLGEQLSRVVTTDARIPLLNVPEGTTHVRVTALCLAQGSVSWGLDPGGNNPSSVCGGDETKWTTAYFDFPLTPTDDAIYVHPEPGASLEVGYTYLHVERQPLGVNESGETYGVHQVDGEKPDLVGVIGTDADGNGIQGYARASDLYAFGPDHPTLPSNPEEAIRWQEERNAKYPNGWDIPVYKADGVTQIGVFHVQNG